MTGTRVPLEGRTLVLGPSQAGKTRLTARTVERWLAERGTEGVVVLEFAPEVERNGEVLGGRLDRFVDLPAGVWRGTLAAHAPRTEGETGEDSVALARDNAVRASRILDELPDDPRAVFVNDVTIAFQHAAGDLDRLTDYCDRAECAVLNALASSELGTTDPVSRREREVVEALRRWADRTITLA